MERRLGRALVLRKDIAIRSRDPLKRFMTEQMSRAEYQERFSGVRAIMERLDTARVVAESLLPDMDSGERLRRILGSLAEYQKAQDQRRSSDDTDQK